MYTSHAFKKLELDCGFKTEYSWMYVKCCIFHICCFSFRWVCEDVPEIKIPMEYNVLKDYDTKRFVMIYYTKLDGYWWLLINNIIMFHSVCRFFFMAHSAFTVFLHEGLIKSCQHGSYTLGPWKMCSKLKTKYAGKIHDNSQWLVKPKISMTFSSAQSEFYVWKFSENNWRILLHVIKMFILIA